MKKTTFAVLLVCMAAVMCMEGCAPSERKSAVITPTPAPTVTPTPAPTATPTPVPLKTLGEKVDGAYEIQLKNATGKAIKAFSVKSDQDEAFPESILEEGDLYAAGEERIIYYKTEESAGGETEQRTYEIQLTFEDDMVRVLHEFPFEDLEKGEICAEEDIIYLTYNSLSTDVPVSTKAAEIMALIPSVTPTAVPTAAPASAQQTSNRQGSSSQSGASIPSYNYDDEGDEDTDDGSDRIQYGDDERIFYEDPVDTNGEDTSGGDVSGGDTSGGDTSGGDTTEADGTGGDSSGSDTSGGDDREFY